MTAVDPFLIPIPQELTSLSDSVRQYFEYKDRVIHDLYLRTGGADDLVEVAASRDVYDGTFWAGLASKIECELRSVKAELNYSQVQEIDKAIEKIKGNLFYLSLSSPEKLNAVTVSGGTYNAVSGDFINTKRGAKIVFPEHGNITIRNGDGSTISLDGYGKLINGKSTGKLYNKGTCIQFYHFVDDDEWFAR